MTDLTDHATKPQHLLVVDQIELELGDLADVAAWLGEHGDALPRPWLTTKYVRGVGILRCLRFLASSREEFAAVERAMARGARKAEVQKAPTDDGDELVATRMFGSVSVDVWTARENVCERRQIGVEEVEVPAVDVPMVTVERPVYAWDCAPTLSAGTEAAG